MVADLKEKRLQSHCPPAERHASLQAALDRRFLRGLSAEWKNAIWLLPEPLRWKIHKPLFSIRDMPSTLGTWNYQNREISLSRDLVTEGRWDDIREVLLHEMSHQVAHEGLNAVSESDHGKGFRRACEYLRANPKASGSFLPLSERLKRGEPLSQQDKIVVRIHKLMALAESSHIHEAKAAMKKAHQLILNHNVKLIENESNRNYHSIFLDTPRLRHFREAYHLAHLLQDYYFVQGMWVQAWVLDKEKMGRVLEISGTRTNIQIAEYVHDSVRRYIDMSWRTYRQGKKLNRFRKTDYAIGIIEGFQSTLKRSTEQHQPTGNSELPVWIEDKALTRFVSRRYPHVRSFTRKGSGCDARVLKDGREKGRRLVVSKGISQHEGYRDHRIEFHGDTDPC
jgi:hypothetical protein